MEGMIALALGKVLAVLGPVACSFLADAALSFQDIFGQVGIQAFLDGTGEYQTLTGFVLSRLERIPVTGDAFEWEAAGDAWIEVSSMECTASTRFQPGRSLRLPRFPVRWPDPPRL